MPLDFSPLQTIDPAGAFYRGQEAARAEQDRRMMRQFQMEQGLAQRENIQAQREERQAMARRRGQEEEEARRRRESLDKAADMLAKAGANLDLPTLNQGLAFAMQSGNQEAAKVMSQLRSDFIAQQEYEKETKRIFGGGVEPANALAAPAIGGAGPAIPAGAPPTGEAPTGAAPVNAMMAPPGVTRERVQQMLMSPSARMQAQGKALAPTLEKGPSTPDVATMQALGFPLTPQGYADYRKAQREEKAYEPSELQKTLDDLRKATPGSPEAKALQARVQMLTTREQKEAKEPAIRSTKVELADGSIGVMNLDTGEITPAKVGGQVAKGKPSAFAEKAAAQRKQLGVDLDRAITELKDASKEGGLIDQSTGSGAGRLVDVGAGFFGKATPGAIAIGKLAPIADLVLKMVPRFEGPQSDKDTKSYKEAAGQLSDATLPTKIRKDAAKQIVRLMEARKGQFATQDMATEGVGAAPAGTPQRREIAPGVFVTERP